MLGMGMHLSMFFPGGEADVTVGWPMYAVELYNLKKVGLPGHGLISRSSIQLAGH